MAFILAGAAVMTALSLGNAADTRQNSKVRVGVYDNRAIAVAYFNSAAKHESVASWKMQHDKARQAGDEKRAKQIETAMDRMQWLAHRQGFGRASVDEAMASVKDKLADVAKKANVSAIVYTPDYLDSAWVERVDVTSEVVALFDPSEKTLKTVDAMKKIEPVEIGFDFEE